MAGTTTQAAATVAIDAAMPGVGSIVTSLYSAIQALGIKFKGPTQHMSYDLATTRANSYATTLYGDFVTAYGAGVDTIKDVSGNPLWAYVVRNFLSAMNTWWGVNGHPIGIPIHNDITSTVVSSNPQPLRSMCYYYWLWVIMGMDLATV